uniref:Uncharacterized protein n=1 Tax=Arundo donax TaxID=35708 RepID=A0A0A9H303_ARUDO
MSASAGRYLMFLMFRFSVIHGFSGSSWISGSAWVRSWSL